MLQGVSQMLPKVEDLPSSTFLDTCNVHGLLNVQLFRTFSEKKKLCATLQVADKIIFVCFVCLYFVCLCLCSSQFPYPSPTGYYPLLKIKNQMLH